MRARVGIKWYFEDLLWKSMSGFKDKDVSETPVLGILQKHFPSDGALMFTNQVTIQLTKIGKVSEDEDKKHS